MEVRPPLSVVTRTIGSMVGSDGRVVVGGDLRVNIASTKILHRKGRRL